MNNWEKTVIGTVLLEPGTWIEADRLQPKDFLGADHQKMWEVIMELARTNSISPTVLTEKLRSEGSLDSIGDYDHKGESYIYNILSNGDPVGIKIFVSEVMNASLKRDLSGIAAAMNHDAYNGRRADEIIDDYMAKLSMLRKTKRNKAVPISELVANTIERLKKLQAGEMAYPWYPRQNAIRQIIGGCDEGDFILVPSFPGGGKSSYARFEAIRTAQDGQGVLFLNLENPPEFFTIEGCALLTGIDNIIIRNSKFWTKEVEDKIMDGFDRLTKLPLYTPLKTGLISVQDAVSIVRYEITQHEIKFIIVDHLQILGNEKDKSDYERIITAAQVLRGLAQETGIPIMCTAQTNRNNQNRDATSESIITYGRRPKLSDIQYAGEQPAKKILAPYLINITDSEGGRNLNNQNSKGEGKARKDWNVEYMRVAVIKNSSGPTGDTDDIEWHKSTGDFRTLVKVWNTAQAPVQQYISRGFNPIPKEKQTRR